MKKVWNHISRPARIAILLLGTVCLAVLIYILQGAPSLSREMAFRRQERAFAVGPSNIIAQFEFTDEPRSHSNLTIGETENIYTLYSSMPDNHDIGFFYWYPKTGKMGLYVAPASSAVYFADGNHIFWNRPLHLLLFDADPNAVRAELEFEVTFDHDMDGVNVPHTLPISATAQREHDQFFLFSVYADSDTKMEALNAFASICYEYNNTDLPVTVRLYNAADELIATEVILPGRSV